MVISVTSLLPAHRAPGVALASSPPRATRLPRRCMASKLPDLAQIADVGQDVKDVLLRRDGSSIVGLRGDDRSWLFVDSRPSRRCFLSTGARQAVVAAAAAFVWWSSPPSRKKAPQGYHRGPLPVLGAQGSMSALDKIRRAKLDLQNLDENLVDLMIQHRGTAEGVRRELTRVMKELGQPALLARQLLDEEPDVDFDALQPYVDELGVKLPLAISWTSEADDCQNGSCAAQEVDEARENYLDATEMLIKMEQLVSSSAQMA